MLSDTTSTGVPPELQPAAVRNVQSRFVIDMALTSDQLLAPLNNFTELETEARAPVVALTPAQQAAFTNITHFASAAYCTTASVRSFTCGDDCERASPGFQVVDAGESNSTNLAPRWFVGWDPRNLDMSGPNRGRGTIVVGHQGSASDQSYEVNFSNNIMVGQVIPNQFLFPGTANLMIHGGYARAQESTAAPIFAAVQSAMRRYGATSIVVTGHSQGGAVALLDGVSIKLRLGTSSSVSVISYAMPRTGNVAWADFVDRTNIYVRHVNNVGDPVPNLPPMDLRLGPDLVIPGIITIPAPGPMYRNVKGELHIQTVNGTWFDCPGRDNPDPRCTTGVVGNLTTIVDVLGRFGPLVTDFKNFHGGPYNGIRMGAQCNPPVL